MNRNLQFISCILSIYTLATSTIAYAQPITTPAASAALHPFSLVNRDIADFYRSYTFNITAFYADFMTNRYSYLSEYRSFFLTHSFTNQAFTKDSYFSNEFSELLTYTDNSFTTILDDNKDLQSNLATVAQEFPWYSDWVKKDKSSAASSTATENAAARLGLPLSSPHRQSITRQQQSALRWMTVGAGTLGVVMCGALL